jgi:hypothetical protein
MSTAIRARIDESVHDEFARAVRQLRSCEQLGGLLIGYKTVRRRSAL